MKKWLVALLMCGVMGTAFAEAVKSSATSSNAAAQILAENTVKPARLNSAGHDGGIDAALGKPATRPAAKRNAAGPEDTVKVAVEGVVRAAQADPDAQNGDMRATAKIVERVFLPYTDFRQTVSLAVSLKVWKGATDAQREKLFKEFQTLLVRTYALQLTQIRDQKMRFQYDPPITGAKGAVVINTHAMEVGGDAMNVGYRLYKTAQGWRIYDIDMMGAGAWLIETYQQQFASQLSQGGIDGLIQYLAAHNARFAQ